MADPNHESFVRKLELAKIHEKKMIYIYIYIINLEIKNMYTKKINYLY